MNGKVEVTYPLKGASYKETFSADAESEGINAFTKDYYESTSKEGGEKVVIPYYNAQESPLKKEYTVLPTPNGQGAYKLTVDVNGDPKTTIVPAQYMTWQPGYLYTYIFKIHPDGGVSIASVQSAFTSWQDNTREHVIVNW